MPEVSVPLSQFEPDTLKLLGHPLRYAIFMKLGERPWSAKELERDLGEDRKRISEQIGLLAERGLAELVTEQPGAKGGLMRMYRSGRYYFTAEQWAALPEEARVSANFTISRLLVAEIGDALASGSFESHGAHALLRHPLWTDDQGVRDIEEIMVQAHRDVERVERESLERRHSTEPSIRLITALLSFPAAPDASESGPENCPS